MTPYTAIASMQRTAPQEHRLLCAACAEALLEELSAMFPPVEEPHAVVLSQCALLGCTFDVGTPAQCVLHPFLHEKDTVCP